MEGGIEAFHFLLYQGRLLTLLMHMHAICIYIRHLDDCVSFVFERKAKKSLLNLCTLGPLNETCPYIALGVRAFSMTVRCSSCMNTRVLLLRYSAGTMKAVLRSQDVDPSRMQQHTHQIQSTLCTSTASGLLSTPQPPLLALLVLTICRTISSK